jgi:hypothetical protein
MYPSVWLRHTQWVHLEVFKTNSHIGSILPQTLNGPIEYMIEYVIAILWAHFERTLNEWLRFVEGPLRTNCERTLRVLSKGCLLDILMGSFRTHSKLTHWV